MKRIVVEAYEDPSRPQGGHAVILLRGVEDMPDRPSIRLRPVEAELGGSNARGLWRGGRLQPLATRATAEGIELVIGPDVVGHPNLLTGTPVIIEVPEAELRGEFLWPSVTPLAQPRRRHVVVPRQRASLTPAIIPAAANDAHPAADGQQQETTPAPAAEFAGNLALRVDPHAAEPAPAAQPLADAHSAQAAEPDAVSAAASAAPPTAAEPAAATDGAAAKAAIPPAPAVPATAESTPAGRPPEPQRVPGGLAWTPERIPGGVRRNLLRYGLAAAAVLALGLYVKSRYAVDPDMQLSDRFVRPPAAQGAAPVPPAQGGMAAASGKGGSQRDAGTKAAAAGPAAVPAKPAAPPACGAPQIETQPLAAGRMRVAIAAGCRAREDVHLVYGGADQIARLDDSGRLTWVLDAFAGDKDQLELRFDGGVKSTVPVKANDLDRVSKVAVVWQRPVDLDLHAFEYAALAGSRGHVWAGAAGTSDAAASAVGSERKGRGFLSTANDGTGAGDRVEVYTFVHAEVQAAGAVGLALDHATRGDDPGETTCGKGDLAEVPYTVVVLARGSSPRRESGLIAAAPCGVKLGQDVRLRQSAMPVLRIKN